MSKLACEWIKRMKVIPTHIPYHTKIDCFWSCTCFKPDEHFRMLHRDIDWVINDIFGASEYIVVVYTVDAVRIESL